LRRVWSRIISLGEESAKRRATAQTTRTLEEAV